MLRRCEHHQPVSQSGTCITSDMSDMEVVAIDNEIQKSLLPCPLNGRVVSLTVHLVHRDLPFHTPKRKELYKISLDFHGMLMMMGRCGVGREGGCASEVREPESLTTQQKITRTASTSKM